MNILVAEDDEGISKIINLILEDKKYTVYKALNVSQMDEVLKKEKVSLILLDVSFGGSDGSQIVRKRKAGPAPSNIPIVLMSAHHDLKNIAKKVKADGYLIKPFEIDELLSIVKKFTC